ncbi:MAG: RNA-guided pseudouridylation complex pseudouridine synthase subunit Cbf5 [Candidatus Odinarchaeia archaeon]
MAQKNSLDSPQRTILVRSESVTDPQYGYKPAERPIEHYIRLGVINLDKPAGPTSHEVVAWVKKILNVEKAGHSGTLDPGVTGILPVFLLDATKVIKTMLLAGKEYVAIMVLHKEVDLDKLNKVVSEFTGKIYQRPPLRSAVKRRLRVKKIYYLKILEVDGKHVLMRVGCEAGTYIRKLISDIGEALGCGAHMKELRRTRSGPLKEDHTLITLQDLTDAYYFWKEENDETYIRKAIQPLEHVITHIPRIWVRDTAVDAICHGASLAAPGVVKLETGIQKGSEILICTLKNEAIALAKAKMSSEEILSTTHGLVAETTRVIMERGTYPPAWKTT